MSWIDQRPDDAMDGAFTAVGPENVRTVDPGDFREAMSRLGAAVPQSIDTEDTILEHRRIGLTAPVEAHEQGRRRVAHRADRGRGGTSLAGRPRRGDDMHGGAQPAHGLPEDPRVDRAHVLGSDRREGAIHGIVGALIDPAHGCILNGE